MALSVSGRTADRLDGLEVEAKPLQRSANEATRGKLVAQARVRFGNAAHGDDKAVRFCSASASTRSTAAHA